MKRKILLLLNICIVALACVGTVIMLNSTESATGLTSSGAENLKYFTVLSNEFCGIVALWWLVLFVFDRVKGNEKYRPYVVLLKFVAATAVGLTFSVIAFFLGPIYGHIILYRGSNLVFHLLLPVVAMVELVLTEAENGKLPFFYTWITVIPTVLYGLGYLVNLLVNGVGEWPNTNDWYGFVNWGLPVGLGIFAGIILSTWGIACLLRFLNKISNKNKRK